ncbi:MAG: DASS family sodium-coupled anion symporter [Pirellulales bacterium]
MTSPSHEPRNLIRLWFCVVVGIALWFTPPPDGLNVQAWHVFGVFVTTILSFLVRPLPMGPCVLLALLVLATTGSLAPVAGASSNLVPNPPLSSSEAIAQSFKASLSGFADTTVWLVVAAFLISGAVIESGLGRRLALVLIDRLGRTTLGLAYAITSAEVLLAPFIPSNTARGGGVMAPIVLSLSHALGSDPVTSPRRAGQFLALCGAHANLISSAMFLTGMAANPLVSKAARELLQVEFGWSRWFIGAVVPGLLSALIVPFLLYRLTRPEITDASAARGEAREQLSAMGRWTPRQIAMSIVLVAMLVLWATEYFQKEIFGASLPATLVAMMGVATLVVLGVLPWRSVVGNAAAWDALIWLGGMVNIADALKTTGFVDWFADQVHTQVTGFSPLLAALALALIYFYSMYAFSMLTGHILAFVGVFMTVASSAGSPPLLMVAMLAYFSNLCGCTTHYSSGPIIIYFGLGYVTVARWFAIGFIVSLAHLAIWLGVGLPYWKLLGWW